MQAEGVKGEMEKGGVACDGDTGLSLALLHILYLYDSYHINLQ